MPRGREVFSRLVATADAVYNNLRGDLPDKLGLTYAALSEINPAIVCVSLSAYGREDPRRAEPGYDALVQAEAGWASLTGEPSGPPARSGLPMADYAAGLVAACGLLAGIVDARRTGRGRDLDTSLFDTALAMLSYQATWWLSAGIETRRLPSSAHPSIVPFQFFATADGYIAIACAKEKFFQSLIQVIGMAELAEDPRFGSFAARHQHRADLTRLLARAIARTNDRRVARSLTRPGAVCAGAGAFGRARGGGSEKARNARLVRAPRAGCGEQRRTTTTGFRIHPELPRIAGPRRRRRGSPGRTRL